MGGAFVVGSFFVFFVFCFLDVGFVNLLISEQNVKSDARGAFYHKVLVFFLLKFLSEATNNLALRF
jgi:hypothetical protein